MEFYERVLTARKAKGLSQEALAEELGVSRQAVSKWKPVNPNRIWTS